MEDCNRCVGDGGKGQALYFESVLPTSDLEVQGDPHLHWPQTEGFPVDGLAVLNQESAGKLRRLVTPGPRAPTPMTLKSHHSGPGLTPAD